MADKKISALTAATTPLAGTEVLPIVQGGATVKVSVDDLTAGKAVATGALTTTGVNTTQGGSAGNLVLKRTTNAGAGSEVSYLDTYSLNGSGTNTIFARTKVVVDSAVAGSEACHYVWTQRVGGGFTDVMNTDATGNISALVGNLVIGTSGKGIDFSATSGSGTSELFNDYEEGTWTVVWTNLTGTPASTTGYYTKIGRMVYFTYSTGSGSITGTAASTRFSLPFTPAVEASGTQISQNVAFSFTTLILPSNSTCYVGTFTSNFMVFSGSYHV